MMEGVDGPGGNMTRTTPTKNLAEQDKPIAMEHEPEHPPASSPLLEAKLTTFAPEGMKLISSPSLFTSLCTSIFSYSKPCPSRPSQMEYLQILDVIESLDSIITSIPSSPLEPILVFDIGLPPLPPCIPENPPYNLRSLMKKPMKEEAIGGLEANPISVGPRKMGGRKSNLSKAQVREKIDIVDGN